MRKPCYTKIKNLFMSCAKIYAQELGGWVYLSEEHMIVRIPAEWYREHFAELPELEPGKKAAIVNGELFEHMASDLAKFYHTEFDRNPGEPARLLEPMKHSGRKVQVLETDRDKIILNYQFFDAVKQATRCAAVYAGIRREPVWFYDSPEICNSGFFALVLPVNYSQLKGAA